MVSLVYGEYHDDDDDIVCALQIHPDTFSVQGFSTPPVGTPRLIEKVRPRVEVFFSSVSGKRIKLPYPTTTPPHALGAHVTIRGDANYVKVSTMSEFNRGEIT